MLQGLQELRLQLQQAPKEASATAWGPRSSCQRVASLGCHCSQLAVRRAGVPDGEKVPSILPSILPFTLCMPGARHHSQSWWPTRAPLKNCATRALYRKSTVVSGSA